MLETLAIIVSALFAGSLVFGVFYHRLTKKVFCEKIEAMRRRANSQESTLRTELARVREILAQESGQPIYASQLDLGLYTVVCVIRETPSRIARAKVFENTAGRLYFVKPQAGVLSAPYYRVVQGLQVHELEPLDEIPRSIMELPPQDASPPIQRITPCVAEPA